MLRPRVLSNGRSSQGNQTSAPRLVISWFIPLFLSALCWAHDAYTPPASRLCVLPASSAGVLSPTSAASHELAATPCPAYLQTATHRQAPSCYLLISANTLSATVRTCLIPLNWLPSEAHAFPFINLSEHLADHCIDTTCGTAVQPICNASALWAGLRVRSRFEDDLTVALPPSPHGK